MNFTSSLGVAAMIGAAFGIALEQAGLGSARKLAGQFYFTDFTVFKVLFSALVTAMLGTFWLGRFGLIDFAGLYVPQTFLLPQLAGGVIFGIGFVVSGLCPGTCCVSAATGRIDGIATMAGLFLGVLGSGLAFSHIDAFYGSTARGVFTLPELFGMPYGVVVLQVVVLALVAFCLIERWEQRP
jgi:uncharacterized membrane protein YedE/YeeE